MTIRTESVDVMLQEFSEPAIDLTGQKKLKPKTKLQVVFSVLIFLLGIALMFEGFPLIFDEYLWGVGVAMLGMGFWFVFPKTTERLRSYIFDEKLDSDCKPRS